MSQHQKPETAQASENREKTGTSAASSQRPTKTLRLSRQEAASWLALLNQGLASEAGETTPELESLRSTLEDAAWLARWQREEVRLDLCPSVVASLLETLVRVHAETSAEMAGDFEAILAKLSRS